VLRKAGVLAEGPLLSVYRTDAEALEALQRLMAQGPPPTRQVATALKP
jgi:hypothetical protein